MARGSPAVGACCCCRPDYAAALALIQKDPMLLSGGVEWELQEWISSVGQLATDAPSQSFTR